MAGAILTKLAIRRYREARGWPRRQLAVQLGVSMETVKRWEMGVTRPPVHHLFRMAQLFGVAAAELNDFPPPKPRQKKEAVA
jgi:transcriptional regulator with XRE-family HTH domain